MKNKAILLLTCIAVFSLSFKGDTDERVDLHTIVKIKNEGFNNSKVMETLFQLTDVIGPRLTGSTGMKNAEAYTCKQLKEWGLTAKIEPWGGFGKGWEIEKSYLAMTTPYYQQLIAVPKAWTPGTNGLVKAEAVLVKIEKPEDMAKYIGKLKDKIVVLKPTAEIKLAFTADAKRLSDEELEKMAIDPHVEEPGASNPPRTMPTVTRKQIDSFLMNEGAMVVLSGGRGSTGTVFTSNGGSRAWDAKPTLPELEMNGEHINRLVRLLEAGKEVNMEADTKTTFLTADSTENNVVAEIPGEDPELKNEIVMLGAHMDSWHAATGTTDNGTGAVVMMEAVRILKTLNLHPRRTIRLVLWSGEEQGLLGSRAYVKKHFGDRTTMILKPAQERISAYYNLDNGAGKIRGIYLQNNDEARPIFEAWLEPFKDLGATTATIRTTGSTDHISFDEVGIPGFQFIQDPLEYGSRSHHTNMDVYERVNPNDLMQASIIVASFVYNTAMRDEMIPRKPLPKAKPVVPATKNPEKK